MKLIAVYHQDHHSAPEVAEVLRKAGLHPSFDDLPRYSLNGSGTTPMYVPEDEAEQARKVLADWCDQNELRIKNTIQGWWRPLVLPLLIATVIGVVIGIAVSSVAAGVGGGFIGFIIVLQVWGGLRSRI